MIACLNAETAGPSRAPKRPVGDNNNGSAVHGFTLLQLGVVEVFSLLGTTLTLKCIVTAAPNTSPSQTYTTHMCICMKIWNARLLGANYSHTCVPLLDNRTSITTATCNSGKSGKRMKM